MLDACHRIKLIRNALGDTGEFIEDKGDSIKWNYIKNLHELQETEGLNLANKLRK